MKHTAEEVRETARILNGDVSVASSLMVMKMAARMLNAYADMIERAKAGVTDEVVERACAHYYNSGHKVYPPVYEAMRAALLAVWPATTNPPGIASKLVGSEPVAQTGGGSDADLLQRMDDDAAKWATEFRATALRIGYSDMDEGWLIGWFANAIEHSSDVRRWRREEAQSRAVPDGWRQALERALPFLDDEARKYEDDGNNEPLDVADTIRDLLAATREADR